MKKLMITAAAIAMAVVANAATVSWTVTGVTAPGGTTKTAGYVAYIFDAKTVGAAAVEASILDGTFATTYGKSTGGSYLGTSTSSAYGTIALSGLGDYGAGATTQDPIVENFYTVLFDAGTSAAADNYIVTANVPVTFKSATGVQAALFANITGADGKAWQSIPEPTSGLLLLLGVAGLALRRRRT